MPPPLFPSYYPYAAFSILKVLALHTLYHPVFMHTEHAGVTIKHGVNVGVDA